MGLPLFATASSTDLTIGTQTWSPLASPDQPNNGILPTLINKALQPSEFRISLIFTPPDQCLEDHHKGKNHGCLIWNQVDQWSDDLIYSRPIMRNSVSFYKRVYSNRQAKPITALYQQRIGYSSQQPLPKLMQQLIKRNKIEAIACQSLRDCFDQLLTAKVDWIVSPTLIGDLGRYHLLNGSERQAIKPVQAPFNLPSSFLVADKNQTLSQDLINALNQGIENLQSTGEWQQTLQNFVTKPVN